MLRNLFAVPTSFPSVALDDPRQRLRDAKHAERLAEEAVEREVTGSDRARKVLTDLRDAQAALTAAESAYVASASAWAAEGAHGDIVGDPLLLANCESIRTQVYRLQLAAKGAEAALAQTVWDKSLGGMTSIEMTIAEQSARETLNEARSRTARAVWDVLVAEVEPAAQRALTLHAELADLLPTLHGFARLIRQNTPFRGDSSEFAATLRTVTSSPVPNENELVDLMRPWLKFGQSLMHDADATLE